MKFENSSALNIIYLLLDFYKTLGLKEREVMVILMINQLLTQGNDFITSDVLSLKMNLTMNEIDESLSILFTKKYIEFEEHNNTLTTSIEPIKKILIKLFEKSIFFFSNISINLTFRKLNIIAYIIYLLIIFISIYKRKAIIHPYY